MINLLLFVIISTVSLFLIIYILFSAKTKKEIQNKIMAKGDDSNTDIKKKMIISSLITSASCIAVILIFKISKEYLLTIMLPAVILPPVVIYEIEKYSFEKLDLIYADIFLEFEIGIKANIEIDAIFNIIAAITTGKVSSVFQQAGAIYRKGSDKRETMDFLYSKIKTVEIDMLRSAIIQIDQIGIQGVKTIETLTDIAMNKRMTYLIKKKELMQYATVFAVFFALVGMFAVLVFPMLDVTNDSILKIL